MADATHSGAQGPPRASVRASVSMSSSYRGKKRGPKSKEEKSKQPRLSFGPAAGSSLPSSDAAAFDGRGRQPECSDSARACPPDGSSQFDSHGDHSYYPESLVDKVQPPCLPVSAIIALLSPVLMRDPELFSTLSQHVPRREGRRLVPEPVSGQVWQATYSEDTCEACDEEPDISNALAAKLHGSGGTVGTFTPYNQFLELVRWSGGRDKLTSRITALLGKCEAAPGGLAANLPRLAFDPSGTLAMQCLTCTTWHAVANSGHKGQTTPFHNYLRHSCQRGHEKARERLIQEAGLGQCSEAYADEDVLALLKVLLKREAAISAPPVSTPPPPVAPLLQPIGVEPLRVTRDSTLRSLLPKQVCVLPVDPSPMTPPGSLLG